MAGGPDRVDPQRLECGPRKSEVVLCGDLAFLAGRVCSDSEGRTTYEQTCAILADIDRLLGLAGTDRSRLVSSTVWLTDISEIAEMNRAWQDWIPPGHAPARATVQAVLGGPHYKVEIAIVAAR